MLDALLSSPMLSLGAILVVGALLGDGAERARIPWITGCILAGLLLGPVGAGLLRGPVLAALDGVAQVALAVIAFNIGCQLALSRLAAIGRSIVLLAVAQLLAPLALVLAAEGALGLALPTALIVAAAAPMTAPTTTFSVIQRRQATGPFVDRALGILAINDAVAVLIFSVASAAAVGLPGAQASGAALGATLRDAALSEALSLLFGGGLGGVYLVVRRILEDGRPGWEPRLTATLLGLLLLGIGGAVSLGLSHLLVPLGLGIAVANGVAEAERRRVRSLIRGLEDPLFIVFFVLAGAHLPLSAAENLAVLLAAVVYVAGRFGGKYGAIFLTASALRLDRPTRTYLGLCFPSQGGLAMGAVLALKGSAAVQLLPPGAAAQVEAAISVILVAVLVSQLAGPALIDLAVRRGVATTSAPDASPPDRTGVRQAAEG
jgi:Kef-type K+ transport system membrane component KefB